MFDWWAFIGVLGMSFVLIAFLMLQFNQWRTTTVSYHVLNFLGGTFLMLYAFVGKVVPFFVLNLIWALVSLLDVFKCSKRKKRSIPTE